ncbi:MAG: heme biosynthesis protein HemY [Alcanivorax sp.]|nr:heme biosynthesis protein HemY [Alcanivorax sp.]
MKRLVVWLMLALTLALLGALWLGSWLLADPGYVLLVHGQREIETSVVFLVLMLVLAGAALILLTLFMAPLWRFLTPASWTGWRRRQAAQRQLQQGLLELAAGHWQRAEGLLTSSARRADWPLLPWLAAAVAARQTGDGDAMRAALAEAASAPSGRLPALLLRARIALYDGAPQRARELLEPERKRYGDSPVLMNMLAEAYGREGNWAGLCELIPALRKMEVDPILSKKLDRREYRAWLGRMRQAASMPGFNNASQRRETLARLWKKVPQRLRTEPALRAQYAGYLAQFGDGPTALKVIERRIGKDWDDGLVAVLEAIDDVPPEQLLARLEHWLTERPGNQRLLLTAGRVALKAQLWGKARAFFETAGHAGNAVALAELARLLVALGERDAAAECLTEQVALTGKTLPSLPLPRKKPALAE